VPRTRRRSRDGSRTFVLPCISSRTASTAAWIAGSERPRFRGGRQDRNRRRNFDG
jgi:hypothetical protein